jgi:hypothetical protein
VLPHLAGLCIEGVRAGVMVVRFEASTRPVPVGCPGYRTECGRVHSRYVRRLSDTPIGAREVLLQVRVRRLFCDNSECARRTFTEPLPGLASKHARRTSVLQRVLCAVAGDHESSRNHVHFPRVIRPAGRGRSHRAREPAHQQHVQRAQHGGQPPPGCAHRVMCGYQVTGTP